MENEIKKDLNEVAEAAETVEAKVEEVNEVIEDNGEAVELIEEGVSETEAALAEAAEEVKETEEKVEEAVEEVKEAVEEAPKAEEPAPVAAPAAPVAAAVAPAAAVPAAAAAAVAEEKPKAMGKRVGSAILGTLGILTSSTGIFGLIFSIISLCLGFSAKKKSGKGRFAITLGFIGLILTILCIAAAIYFFTNSDQIFASLQDAGYSQEQIDMLKDALSAYNA